MLSVIRVSWGDLVPHSYYNPFFKGSVLVRDGLNRTNYLYSWTGRTPERLLVLPVDGEPQGGP